MLSWKQVCLYLIQELLLAALKTNQQDYIKLLLEEGVEIKEEYLPELYEQVSLI